ncbi:biliverdin-producing heme oxygenase [Pseudomonas entomophila]|uniref:biliverdin-producing heme oxygenase n=1 Tax=Pseudomonas entomophila TaxID=312306 RepID=UPI0023D8AA81|nr:biliverdin-producing heme oxygenase [Pseudomonas entomophila]MDF0733610.1 biliverdin-producing heme oxygenase [Pseudomonas entomophila]
MPSTAHLPTSPLLLALRAGTQASHKALERRLPFFSAGFDQAAYRQLIAAYYGFHAPLETLLTEHQARARDKTPALARDLQALALSPAQIDALPRCQALPAVADAASALGVMYVLEGSTLGGQVLKRAMAERLGIDASNGGAFLDVYGSATGQHWRAFLDRLGQAPATAQASAVQAAVATFERFEQWLEQRQVLL